MTAGMPVDEVRIISTWGGADTETTVAAELQLTLSEIELPDETREDLRISLSDEITHQLQPIADKAFDHHIRVVVSEIRRGSIEILFLLTTGGTAVYKFFKDYEDLRTGVTEFTRDVMRVSNRLTLAIQRIIQHYRRPPKR
jgi:hypothetical protein